MAARKNKRGRRRNRGRFGFLYVLLSFLLIAAALIVGSIVFFQVDTIQVTGQARYTSEEIIEAAQVEPGDNLFRLNKVRMVNRLLQKLPYLRSVSIRRVWPDTLSIHVTESAPAAAIQGAEGWFLLDARGKLLEFGPESLSNKAGPITGLTPLTPTVGTRLAVDQEQQGKLDGLVALLSALESHSLLQNVTSLDLTGSTVITFGYASRFTVEIPMSCEFDYKVRVLDYAVTNLEENETGLIDLTRTDAHFIPNTSLP